jgi:hypothetical protein
MNRIRWNLSRALFAALVAVACLTTLHGETPASNAHRIAVFGSSVANGTGNELGEEGYTGHLRAMLAPHGWEVLNQPASLYVCAPLTDTRLERGATLENRAQSLSFPTVEGAGLVHLDN